MKYIRTKDGIYPVSEEELKSADENGILNTNYGQFYLNEIINQADTIKELCDEFVVEVPDVPKRPYLVYGMSLDEIKQKYTKIYGAIWTDKGLIYVAKMNEKGELELL